ncbi:unnamed protein product, partial [marine sediment metagenome]
DVQDQINELVEYIGPFIFAMFLIDGIKPIETSLPIVNEWDFVFSNL